MPSPPQLFLSTHDNYIDVKMLMIMLMMVMVMVINQNDDDSRRCALHESIYSCYMNLISTWDIYDIPQGANNSVLHHDHDNYKNNNNNNNNNNNKQSM
jgi:hypothetical protein